MSENKIGIEESMDVLIYADNLFNKMHEAKSDDGKIDAMEVGSAMLSSAPDAVRALIGASDIEAELKDLDNDERDALVLEAMKVIRNAVSLFVPGLAEKK